jgi:uncharacterized damage-inducible protein DinB
MNSQQFAEYARLMLAPTIQLFRQVPEDKIGWQPTKESFTAGQLMHHMAFALQFNANGIGKNEWSIPSLRHVLVANRRTPTVSVNEAVSLYEKTSAQFLETFTLMPDDEFFTAEVDSIQLGKVQKWKIALFALDHHLNHKAELFMYLKLMGIKVHSGDLYGKL